MDLSEIQMRLYKATLLTGIGLSVASIIANLLVGFPLEMSLKWLLLLCLCGLSLFYSGSVQRGRWMLTLYVFLIFVIFLFLIE